MKASDLFASDAASQLSQPRIDAYVAKACAFLRDQFPQRLATVADAPLEMVVRAAMERNTAHGLVRDADHLTALIPVVFWGSRFESDPQHRPGLVDIGWLTTDGKRAQNAPPMLLADLVDAYRNAVRSDLDEIKRPMRAFEVLFGRDEDRDDDQACLATMRAVFPARTARMSANQTRAFLDETRAHADALDLSGADLVAHVTLSLYFGVGFASDPLHGWAHAPYHDVYDTLEDKRLALGAGVQSFLAPFVRDADAEHALKEAI